MTLIAIRSLTPLYLFHLVPRKYFLNYFVQLKNENSSICTRAIITHSWFETADFRAKFPCLVHKLSLILTALDYKLHWKMYGIWFHVFFKKAGNEGPDQINFHAKHSFALTFCHTNLSLILQDFYRYGQWQGLPRLRPFKLFIGRL